MARAAAKKVKPRKRLTGDERRESILEAALGCFLEKGYIATTINDIREASGATTGSIYHFFDGKGALAMALLEDAVAGWSGESKASSDTAEAVIKASAGRPRELGPQESRAVPLHGRNPHPLGHRAGIRRRSPTPWPRARARPRPAMRKFVKARKVKDLPWPVAHSLILGPAYNYLRLATTGRARVAAKRAAEICRRRRLGRRQGLMHSCGGARPRPPAPSRPPLDRDALERAVSPRSLNVAVRCAPNTAAAGF